MRRPIAALGVATADSRQNPGESDGYGPSTRELDRTMSGDLEVTQEFMFSAAHRLPGYDGPCEDVHGHNYKLTVTVKGPVHNRSGMVIDFRTLEEVVKKNIFPQLDHRMLNDFMENPTAEYMVVWIWGKLKDDLPGLCRLTLYEQPGSSVTYCGPEGAGSCGCRAEGRRSG